MKVTEVLRVQLSGSDIKEIIMEHVREVMRGKGYGLTTLVDHDPLPAVEFEGAPLRPRVGDES
jgi:hypothetical protein